METHLPGLVIYIIQVTTSFRVLTHKGQRKLYQHPDECCFASTVLPKHHNNLRVCELSFHYIQLEVSKLLTHVRVLVSCIGLHFPITLLWCIRNLDKKQHISCKLP